MCDHSFQQSEDTFSLSLSLSLFLFLSLSLSLSLSRFLLVFIPHLSFNTLSFLPSLYLSYHSLVLSLSFPLLFHTYSSSLPFSISVFLFLTSFLSLFLSTSLFLCLIISHFLFPPFLLISPLRCHLSVFLSHSSVFLTFNFSLSLSLFSLFPFSLLLPVFSLFLLSLSAFLSFLSCWEQQKIHTHKINIKYMHILISRGIIGQAI